tara:strand:+ start:3067 stop:3864 length:798 start_codon:yes stop_codon:yes gene_type:complete
MYKSSPTIHAFLTVRMKSSRLKKKALLKLGKLTILDRAVINLSASKYINDVIILTSTNKDDNPIIDLCKKRNLKFFRGSEDDVLDRFLRAARVNKTDIIVRATGDNPFVSFEIANFLIKSHLDKNADFTGIIRDNIPGGVSTEIISSQALERLLVQDLDFSLSEYMTYYFINNPDFFNLNILEPPNDFVLKKSKIRLTIDYKEDYELAKIIIKAIKPENRCIELNKILSFFKANVKLFEKNQNLPVKWEANLKLKNKLKKATRII